MSARSNWTWNRSPVPSSSTATLSLATPRNTNRRHDDRRAPSPRNRRIQIYPALMNSWFARRLIGNNGNNERAVLFVRGVVGARNRTTDVLLWNWERKVSCFSDIFSPHKWEKTPLILRMVDENQVTFFILLFKILYSICPSFKKNFFL